MSSPSLPAPCPAHGQADGCQSCARSSREPSRGEDRQGGETVWGVKLWGQGDLVSPVSWQGWEMLAVGAAVRGPSCARHGPRLRVCSSPALLAALRDAAETAGDVILKPRTKEHQLCCGLLSQLHWEQTWQGLPFSLH